eukprot:154729-Rhodomonas_salina.1
MADCIEIVLAGMISGPPELSRYRSVLSVAYEGTRSHRSVGCAPMATALRQHSAAERTGKGGTRGRRRGRGCAQRRRRRRGGQRAAGAAGTGRERGSGRGGC